MELVQSRIVTEDVEQLAAFYAALVGTRAALNDYYVEIQAGPAAVACCKRRYTEHWQVAGRRASGSEVILDFLADDADAEYPRIRDLGVEWVVPPTTQPWGSRSMIFADPQGGLVNVFSRPR